MDHDKTLDMPEEEGDLVESADESLSGDDVHRRGTSESKAVSDNETDSIEIENLKLGIDDNAIAKVEVLIDQLSGQVAALETLFNKRIMHADYEDKVIDQLHGELQKYKGDLYAQLIRPILLDIIAVRDSIMRNVSIYSGKPEGERDIPNKMFADYAYELQDILEKYNVEVYSSAEGDNFIPMKQRVVKKEIIDDESLHGKIAESLSSGYSYEGRVISNEKVSVYFYKKNHNVGEEK